MTRQDFLQYCADRYDTAPDYPFDDLFETAVLRHSGNRKWYALVMKISRRKFGQNSDEGIDVVNMKLPTEMLGSFGTTDGVYPAFHMNKLHWVSVLLPDTSDNVVQFLVNYINDKKCRRCKMCVTAKYLDGGCLMDPLDNDV